MYGVEFLRTLSKKKGAKQLDNSMSLDRTGMLREVDNIEPQSIPFDFKNLEIGMKRH